MAITREQIYQAADELNGQGVAPTLAAVRKRVGSGSYTTISDIMSEWRAERKGAEQPAANREPAPQSIADRLAAVGDEIWSLALEQSSERLKAAHAEFDVTRNELEQARDEAGALADQLAEELQATQAQIAAMNEQVAAAQSRSEELAAQLSWATERAILAETRVAGLEQRVGDLNDELVRVNAANTEMLRVIAGSSREGKKAKA
jgi:chromosome segregation ATPase